MMPLRCWGKRDWARTPLRGARISTAKTDTINRRCFLFMKCLQIWGVGNLSPVIYYRCYRPEPHGHDAAGSGFASNGNAQNCRPFRDLPLNAVLYRSSVNGVTMT